MKKRIQNLERALAYAKWRVITEEDIKEIERLERGE